MYPIDGKASKLTENIEVPLKKEERKKTANLINDEPSASIINPYTATWEAATAPMTCLNVITQSTSRNLAFDQQDPQGAPLEAQKSPL